MNFKSVEWGNLAERLRTTNWAAMDVATMKAVALNYPVEFEFEVRLIDCIPRI